MKIAISSQSAADLSKELIKEFNIHTTSFTILLGDKIGLDGEITGKDIIEFVNKNKILPKTSAINQSQFDEHLLKEYDAVIHFSISSELSCAYQNALRSASNRKGVYVIDTKSLSTGIGLLCIYASKLVKEGLTAEEIVKKCNERVKYIQASFELKRVDYLYKGGRCSAMTYLGANLLGIHPQIILKDGKMVAGKKYRGNFTQVVKKYCNDILEEFANPDLETVFLTYTTADEKTLEMVKEILRERGFKNIYVTTAGGTITSHCGENCLGILYINDGNLI